MQHNRAIAMRTSASFLLASALLSAALRAASSSARVAALTARLDIGLVAADADFLVYHSTDPAVQGQ